MGMQNLAIFTKRLLWLSGTLNAAPRLLKTLHVDNSRSHIKRLPSTIPFQMQHTVLEALQRRFEHAGFRFHRENVPEALQREKWTCPKRSSGLIKSN